ncbi:MAG: hypothetical protein JWP59_4788 [Massilia sp.]|jgi:hypothetical protein|nr:hypothetical protein [Massilia sp.]
MGLPGERYRVPRGLHERTSNFMEVFQTSWVSAVAAASGAVVLSYEIVDDGLDAMLHHRHPSHSAIPEHIAMLRLQLKATSSPPSNGRLSTQVSRKRFAEYSVRDPSIATIVAILSMPSMREHWTFAGHRALSLFGRCAWVNLDGETLPSGNPSDKVTIHAPLTQQFDDVTLAQIMERIGAGGKP